MFDSQLVEDLGDLSPMVGLVVENMVQDVAEDIAVRRAVRIGIGEDVAETAGIGLGDEIPE